MTDSLAHASMWKPIRVERPILLRRTTHTEQISDLPRVVPTRAEPAFNLHSGAGLSFDARPATDIPSLDSPVYPLWEYLQRMIATSPLTPLTDIVVEIHPERGFHLLLQGLSAGPYVSVEFYWVDQDRKENPPYGIYSLDLTNGNFCYWDLNADGQTLNPDPYPCGWDYTYLDYVKATINAVRFVAEDPANTAVRDMMLRIALQIENNIGQFIKPD